MDATVFVPETNEFLQQYGRNLKWDSEKIFDEHARESYFKLLEEALNNLNFFDMTIKN